MVHTFRQGLSGCVARNKSFSSVICWMKRFQENAVAMEVSVVVTMNKHDRDRINKLIKTLQTAEEQANNVILYLTAGESPQKQLWDAVLVLEYIQIALERLRVQ